MPKRVFQGQKKIPGLNFDIRFIVNLSVASEKNIQEDFYFVCTNNGTDKAKKLREILYKNMNLKDEKEFYQLVNDSIRTVKRIIYERVKKVAKKDNNDCFSEVMIKDIKEYINKNKGCKNA